MVEGVGVGVVWMGSVSESKSHTDFNFKKKKEGQMPQSKGKVSCHQCGKEIPKDSCVKLVYPSEVGFYFCNVQCVYRYIGKLQT